MTLTFELLTPKSIGVFNSIRAITLWRLKALAQRVFELLSGNGFHSLDHYDLDLWPTDPKIKRVFYSIRATTLWSLKAPAQRVLKILSGNGFHSSCHCDLTFDLLTPKSKEVFYSIRALGQRVLELLSGNGFHSSGHCDLDIWPTDPKINMGLLLNKGYHRVKFESSGSEGTWVIERKRFSLFGSLWPWPLTYWPKIIRVL